ncbi:hypothetical protein CK216_11470 [Mesorhizobium sp. WSM3876]|nr:hypothetical protein CK216_11470 [Mesorhizobium sp. WSM3876]
MRQTRYLAAVSIVLSLCLMDGALFNWRVSTALGNLLAHSLERQAETAETKVEIYDALWSGLLGVPVKKR